MDATGLLRVVQEAVSGLALEMLPGVDSQTTIRVSADQLPVLARTLRDHPDLRFALLIDVTAVDYWPREPRFEVVYLFVSIEKRLRLRVKVPLHGAAAVVATISDLWPAANWLEREVWDLFGIAFDGHPDLRRLLMPDDWDGHPLRKDYPVQIRKGAATSMPLQVTEEEFRANLERDRMKRG
jgi:NADH-quinone oxidoreductase subunit C